MKKLLTLALAGALLFGTSCTKDENDNGPETPSTLSPCTYSPYKVGSVMVQNNQGETVTTNFTEEKSLDGHTWLYSESSNNATGYFRCGEGYVWIHSDAGATNGLTLRVMKTAALVDDTWTDSFTINTIPTDYVRTVSEIDGTRTVEGIEYTDVATVDIVMYVDYGFGDGPQPITSYTEYHSKAFGFIESSLDATLISLSI